MNISPYSALLERKIFLPSPNIQPIEMPGFIKRPGDMAIDTQLRYLKYMTTQGLTTRKDEWFVRASEVAKSILISTQLPPDDFVLIYKLWEIRLTSLVVSNDAYCASIAKQESKKISGVLFKLTQLLHGDSREIGFPQNMPLSLELLIIRLRTAGPSVRCNSELYIVLWILRETVSNDLTNVSLTDSSSAIIYIIGFNICANLIAKRNFLPFITLSKSVIASIDEKIRRETETKKGGPILEIDKEVRSQYGLLLSLITLILGDYDTSSQAFEAGQITENSLLLLQQVLEKVAPVLDKNSSSEFAKPMSQVPEITGWDTLYELSKNTKITARIVWCLCGLIEVEARNSGVFVDVFRSGKQKNELLGKLKAGEIELIEEIIADESIEHVDLLGFVWRENFTKVYGFE